ncbi:MAG: Mur ligase family protein [Campylobacterales bacterium]|nr:Mur ligase family protein [Campylobacterales bacterium]
MSDFQDFLQAKGAEYAPFDPDRFPKIYSKIKDKIQKPFTIQLRGTNGKGTTGRFIASYLESKNKTVVHFTSPHIKDINERFWKNGKLISNKELDLIHQEILKLLDRKDLQEMSYFEYLNVVAVLFASGCEYLVLEAGLGGEFDSTTSCEADLVVLTKIGLDHQEFLGSSIAEITQTKSNKISSKTIVGRQKESVLKLLRTKLNDAVFVEDKNYKKEDFSKEDEGSFLSENRMTAFLVLKELGFELSPQEIKKSDLKGRLSKVGSNVYVDVGHNIDGAQEINNTFVGKKVVLVYNSFKEKDYFEVLKTLKPIVTKVLYLPVDDIRIANKQEIYDSCKKLDLSIETFKNIEKKNTYLVFGSFSTVKTFLDYWEKL